MTCAEAMGTLEASLESVRALLETIAPTLSIILIITAGIVYGLAQMQPPDTRGRWQSTALGLLAGGIIIAALAGAADLISESSQNLLT